MQPDHLGGFVSGGDPATWHPALWRWAHRELGVRSVIDVGCGEGHAGEYFRSLGCRVLGVDGVDQGKDWIIPHDYTLGPLIPARGEDWDLVWCSEFVEHVPRDCVNNFMKTFAAGRIVMLTHGEQGQPGHNHVNLQTSGYWLDQMDMRGFTFDPELTLTAREVAMRNRFFWVDGPCSPTWWGFHVNHFVRSGLVFRRG